MSDILQLLHFHLVRLHLDMDPFSSGISNQKLPIEVECEARSHSENPNLFLLFLQVKNGGADNQEGGLAFDIQAVGEFQTPSDWDAEKKAWLVHYNGGMILYGLIRGQVAAVTGSFSCGSLLLPTLNWQEIIKGAIEKQIAANSQAGTGKSKTHVLAKKVAAKKPATSIRGAKKSSTALPGKSRKR